MKNNNSNSFHHALGNGEELHLASIFTIAVIVCSTNTTSADIETLNRNESKYNQFVTTYCHPSGTL
jgi:hypothetical protein